MMVRGSLPTSSSLAAAAALVPAVAAAGGTIERDRRLPDELVATLAAAGLFRLLVPRELDGAEADPLTLLSVVETIAAADGSAGWLVNIGATSGILAGFLPPEGAADVFADPRSFVAFVARPSGQARRVPGGYRVHGRWSFASGAWHATWFAATCTVAADTSTAGPPETVILFLPAADYQVLDTWDVAGLRGTNSHDIVVENAFVPTSHAVAGFGPDQQTHPGPLATFGRLVIPVGLAAAALGIGRGAVAAAVELCTTKPRSGGGGTLREQDGVQERLGRAALACRAGEALLRMSIEAAWRSAGTGSTSVEERGAVRLAAAHAAALAAEATDHVWQMAGASALFPSAGIERRFRDAHASTQNVVLSAEQYRLAGRALLGFDPPPLWR